MGVARQPVHLGLPARPPPTRMAGLLASERDKRGSALMVSLRIQCFLPEGLLGPDVAPCHTSPPQGVMLMIMMIIFIVAIFYPFGQFCEIYISLLSLQKQPNTAPNLFQRGVEYGKYDIDIQQ